MTREQRRAATDAATMRADDLFRRGATHHRAGDLAAAAACYQECLALAPAHADALHLLGVIEAGRGRHARAAELLARAIDLSANNPALHNNLGSALSALGQLDAAVASFERAIALRPDYAEAHANLGLALKRLDRPEAALARLDRAVALRPDSAEAWCNRGSVLIALDRLDDALTSLDRAIALRPGHAAAHANQGSAFYHLRRPAEALASFERALALAPDDPDVLANLAAALCDLARFEPALDCAERALAQRPDHAGAHANRARALTYLKRLDEAAPSYDRALGLRPHSADFARNKAHFALLRGDYASGWELFERRWQARGFPSPARNFAQPQWRGEAFDGRVLLLHAEQGFGDTIQFCRYAPMAAARGRVILEVPRALRRLLGCLPGPAGVVCAGDPLPPFDLHCPLMSLPRAFGTELATIPAPIGYLRADPALSAAWTPRLAGAEGPRVGIVWSGRGHNRCLADDPAIPLAALRPLLDCGAALYALQPEIREGDRAALAAMPQIVALGGEFTDFADTAAVIAQLDLVIAVDTALAHLAAALGRPTWVLLNFVPEWRWLLGREDSPWYPTARLFRQPAHGDWTSVIARAGEALRAFVASWRGQADAALSLPAG
jgi:tetratricopeptide (TPR) repeat protein